jgi:hypothetical protein
MKRPRLLTPVVTALALACMATVSAAPSQRIQVTATVVQHEFFGDQDALGDSNINNAELTDPQGNPAGTAAGHCTLISVAPHPTLEQCLLTFVFPSGQIILGGVAPLPAPGVEAEFGILGGTGQFSKARGVAHGVVHPDGTFDFLFTLE